MDAGTWCRLLRENRFAVDPPHWPRAAAITLGSLRTSFDRAREHRRYGALVAVTALQPPVLILGHARSGTSHLHRLLALDDQFAYPSLYAALNPSTFLLTEPTHAERLARSLRQTRPVDNMPLRVSLPEEDELALSLLTGYSPFTAFAFPRHWPRYARYLTFRGVPDEHLQRWKAAFTWFCRKLAWRGERPLLLKSTPHAARIPLLLELFPDARFIHICRNPYAVFQSTLHLVKTTMTTLHGLQSMGVAATDRIVGERVLSQYRVMYDSYFQHRAMIPAGHLHELRFEDLEEDPIGELEKVYLGLGLGGFERLKAKLGPYLDSLKGYRKNVHPPLDPSTRRTIASRWQGSFEVWGYPT